MLKKYFLLCMLTGIFSCLSTNANPVIINDLGGLYLNKNVTEIEMRHADKAIQDYTIKETAKNETEKPKEENIVPVSSESEYTFQRGKMNVSKSDIENNEYEGGRVNASKTIYTDDLGRLHFFGKGNIIKE